MLLTSGRSVSGWLVVEFGPKHLNSNGMLPRNLTFLSNVEGSTLWDTLYFDLNSTCNGDKTNSTVVNSLLPLYYDALDIKLAFCGVVWWFLGRHLPRISVFFVLGWRLLYPKDEEKITKCDSLMFKIGQRTVFIGLIPEKKSLHHWTSNLGWNTWIWMPTTQKLTFYIYVLWSNPWEIHVFRPKFNTYWRQNHLYGDYLPSDTFLSCLRY